MDAATSSAAPAMASRERPSLEPGPRVTASARDATPTRQIASSTAEAKGRPGSANLLMVRASGS